MYASEVQLGWDSTMKRLSPRHQLGNVQYDILCDGVWYRTVRLISDVGAEALRGRGTRVWEVNETKTDDHGDVIVDPTPRVLKDSWVDASREREAVIMQKIREDASKCQDPLVLGLNFDKHFMKIKASWDVTIAGAVDDTHALIRCGRSFEGMAKEPLMIRPPTKKRRAKYDSNGPLGPTGAIKLPDTYVERVLEYDAKIHHRVVFTEVGVTVTEIGTLSGALRALADATRGEYCIVSLIYATEHRFSPFYSPQVRLGASRHQRRQHPCCEWWRETFRPRVCQEAGRSWPPWCAYGTYTHFKHPELALRSVSGHPFLHGHRGRT